MQTVKNWAIVPAAGVGKRMQADKPKQYLQLAGKAVIEHTLSRLLQANVFSAIVVAISKEDPYWSELEIARHRQIVTAPGGQQRADSVLSALKSLQGQASDNDWVLVHDAARPCLPVHDIIQLINSIKYEVAGGLLALPSHDTLKQVENHKISGTMDRNRIWRALTPQMFRYRLLQEALQEAEGNASITDESSAMELKGWQPEIVEGSPENIKITRPEDLALAQFYMEQR